MKLGNNSIEREKRAKMTKGRNNNREVQKANAYWLDLNMDKKQYIDNRQRIENREER